MAYEPDMAIVFDSVTKAVIVSFRGVTVYLPGPMLTERRLCLPPERIAADLAGEIDGDLSQRSTKGRYFHCGSLVFAQ
ncbi:hypothetical protein [Rhizobium leguminosarum]|jgi:hypothetical protein|uniref:hypothetical protein n=1 Tax=Rhizobium leguminosarum TaxID=384 RepID=UPI0013E33340|nr:hypothetical protein [Rhizobium leguminosarum]